MRRSFTLLVLLATILAAPVYAEETPAPQTEEKNFIEKRIDEAKERAKEEVEERAKKKGEEWFNAHIEPLIPDSLGALFAAMLMAFMFIGLSKRVGIPKHFYTRFPIALVLGMATAIGLKVIDLQWEGFGVLLAIELFLGLKSPTFGPRCIRLPIQKARGRIAEGWGKVLLCVLLGTIPASLEQNQPVHPAPAPAQAPANTGTAPGQPPAPPVPQGQPPAGTPPAQPSVPVHGTCPNCNKALGRKCCQFCGYQPDAAAPTSGQSSNTAQRAQVTQRRSAAGRRKF